MFSFDNVHDHPTAPVLEYIVLHWSILFSKAQCLFKHYPTLKKIRALKGVAVNRPFEWERTSLSLSFKMPETVTTTLESIRPIDDALDSLNLDICDEETSPISGRYEGPVIISCIQFQHRSDSQL